MAIPLGCLDVLGSAAEKEVVRQMRCWDRLCSHFSRNWLPMLLVLLHVWVGLGLGGVKSAASETRLIHESRAAPGTGIEPGTKLLPGPCSALA